MSFMSGKIKSSASVVDGKLILSLPNATKPVVWQMEIDHAKASAIEVAANENGEGFTLVQKTPRAQNVEIASFSEQIDAVEGLMAIAHALETAHGQIKPAAPVNAQSGAGSAAQQPIYQPAHYHSSPTAQNRSFSFGKFAGLMAGVVILVVLIAGLRSLTPSMPTPLNTAPNATSSGSASPTDQSGMPMSADDFLRGQ